MNWKKSYERNECHSTSWSATKAVSNIMSADTCSESPCIIWSVTPTLHIQTVSLVCIHTHTNTITSRQSRNAIVVQTIYINWNVHATGRNSSDSTNNQFVVQTRHVYHLIIESLIRIIHSDQTHSSLYILANFNLPWLFTLSQHLCRMLEIEIKKCSVLRSPFSVFFW